MQDRSEETDPGADQDAGLVADVLGGTGEAFDVLVRRYQRQAVSIAYRFLSNAEDAADVAQEAFLRSYRNLDKLTDHRRFAPWLMRIVTNLALNYRRSRRSSTVARLDDSFDLDQTRQATGGMGRQAGFGPPAEAGAEELRVAARAAIEDLPEKQRLALVLSSIEGVPQKEVADVLDCSVELVKWNVFQARKTLKQTLARYLPPEKGKD